MCYGPRAQTLAARRQARTQLVCVGLEDARDSREQVGLHHDGPAGAHLLPAGAGQRARACEGALGQRARQLGVPAPAVPRRRSLSPCEGKCAPIEASTGAAAEGAPRANCVGTRRAWGGLGAARSMVVAIVAEGLWQRLRGVGEVRGWRRATKAGYTRAARLSAA